ncbi:MAG: hypothetical protein AAF587_17480 [Bacteroidota bacterium]
MKPIYIIGILMLGLGVIYSACHPRIFSSEGNLSTGVKTDSKYFKIREMGDYRLTARLIPKDSQTNAAEEGNSLSPNQDASDIYYFQLRMESIHPQQEVLKQGIFSQQAYEDRMMYIRYQMQEDLYLLHGNDSLEAALYHFDDTFGLTPYASCLVAFESHKKDHDPLILIFDDQEFGVGPVKFSFSDAALSGNSLLNF